MECTVSEVLQFVEENDVKFIRLAFCDILGNQKNVSIMPDRLAEAFAEGVSFDASAVQGFLNVEESDLFLRPDPATLAILPWRPSHGCVIRLFCDIMQPDGTHFAGDGRYLLKKAVAAAAEMGYTCQIGSECEFYLTQRDEEGNPTHIPHDQAGYCDIAPLDKGENVRREICLTLEQMGIRPESSHHEQGPGQNEIDFVHSGALTAADDLVTFKSVVKTVAARNGLFASFMPKLYADQSGSGLHINLSLSKDGLNIFKYGMEEHSKAAESFIAGILEHICEMTAFLNPLTNSYARFGSFEAPQYVSWSHQNRSQLIRIPAATGAKCRMELRSADPACNPYIAFALLLAAGLDGIRRGLPLERPLDIDLYSAPETVLRSVQNLPADLEMALSFAEESAFVRSVLPERMLEKFLEIKRGQWERYAHAEDKQAFEDRLYFLTT